MAKIPRNRPDAEMLGSMAEEESFEHLSDGTASRPAPKATRKEAAPPTPYAAFFTPELQERVGKALLNLKVNLYKQGIVDFEVKVLCESDHIVIKAVPAKAKEKQK